MYLEQIFETAISANASDIHIVAGLPPIARVNGQLIHMGAQTLSPSQTEEFTKMILSDRLFGTLKEVGECDTSYNHQERCNFRVNAFLQKGNCALVLRLIQSKIPTLRDLNFPEVFKSLCAKRNGLVLVTGPTGSGKSTTLAAMIDFISKTRKEHIITIEDPVEYIFGHGNGIINQRQVGLDTKGFAPAIRAALREDPDVIVIGEMRDLETISAALTAAETGHLVLSTLHTIGAAKTIDRILDAFPPEQQAQIKIQLSSVLEGVISQQLVQNRSNGRSCVLEIMMANYAISNLIKEGKTTQIPNIMQMGKADGMVLMDQSLINLYQQGDITQQTLFKYASDKNMIRTIL